MLADDPCALELATPVREHRDGYLGVTLINPLTQDSDLQALLDEARSVAAESSNLSRHPFASRI